MKKFRLFLRLFIPVFFSLVIVSCEYDDISYDISSAGNNGLMTYFETYNDFLIGKEAVNGPASFKGKHSLPGDHIPHSFGVNYVDYRKSDGTSNWSNPSVYTNSYHYVEEYDNYWYTDYYYAARYYGIGINSPSAHLHLCLRSWDENPKGTRPGRTWKVKSIVDEQGSDLTGDPDWQNYTDNTMRFEKTDRFVFTVGEKRSQKEEELFGVYPKDNIVYGTYSIGSNYLYPNGSLTLVFPNFKRVLTVTESSFGKVKLKGTENGKTGILELEPID